MQRIFYISKSYAGTIKMLQDKNCHK
uniref:Uncharacterized protein n=1 Tax=Arundo donax TaxID=35708 RepID=A0A0A8Z6C4_ARUDO